MRGTSSAHYLGLKRVGLLAAGIAGSRPADCLLVYLAGVNARRTAPVSNHSALCFGYVTVFTLLQPRLLYMVGERALCFSLVMHTRRARRRGLVLLARVCQAVLEGSQQSDDVCYAMEIGDGDMPCQRLELRSLGSRCL